MPTVHEPPSKRQTLNLRIKPEERDLIDRAARASGKNRTEFILDATGVDVRLVNPQVIVKDGYGDLGGVTRVRASASVSTSR